MRTILVLAAALSASAPAMAETLSGSEIRDLVNGRRIYLATPLGGELPMNYRSGGMLDASGEAIGLGRFLQPKDRGRWWIAGDRLCQQWQSWYDGKRICFTLSRRGESRLFWRQDNGDTGLARLGPAL